jgi:putative transposase
MHGLLDGEVAEIVRLFGEWASSTAPTAGSPSWLLPGAGVVSPASVRRVLDREACGCGPGPGRTIRQPFPDWVEYIPNSIWIYDTTHFTGAGVAATVVEDLVSRKWLAEIVSAEETSTQVQVVVCEALAREGCRSGSAPARTAWSTSPWMIPPGRCWWPSATTARR